MQPATTTPAPAPYYYEGLPDSMRALERVTDEELRARYELLTGASSPLAGDAERTEAMLCEMVARGGPAWEELLARELEPRPERNWLFDWLGEGEIGRFTALRRVRGEPDPLRVVLHGGPTLVSIYPALPPLDVELVAGGPEALALRQPDRSRWRIVYSDPQGRPAATVPSSTSGSPGGLADTLPLQPGGRWAGTLATEDYPTPAGPGEYRVRVLFHASRDIADARDARGLIVFASNELTLLWRAVEIDASPALRARADELFAQVCASARVVAWGRTWDPQAEYEGEPRSEREALWRMGYAALPTLFATLDDPQSDARAKAWALVLLYDITGLNDPREALGVLDGANQDSFARRWRRFREQAGVGEPR